MRKPLCLYPRPSALLHLMMLHIRLCCVFCLSTKAQCWQFVLFCFPVQRRTQRLPSEYTISTHNGIRKKEQRKSDFMFMLVYAFCKRGLVFLAEILFHVWASRFRLSPGPKEKPPIMVLRSPFSSPSTLTSVAGSSLEAKRFNLTPVADNSSSSKAACTRKR